MMWRRTKRRCSAVGAARQGVVRCARFAAGPCPAVCPSRYGGTGQQVAKRCGVAGALRLGGASTHGWAPCCRSMRRPPSAGTAACGASGSNCTPPLSTRQSATADSARRRAPAVVPSSGAPAARLPSSAPPPARCRLHNSPCPPLPPAAVESLHPVASPRAARQASPSGGPGPYGSPRGGGPPGGGPYGGSGGGYMDAPPLPDRPPFKVWRTLGKLSPGGVTRAHVA